MTVNMNLNDKGKIRRIACGGSHSLALTATEDVFSWGYGELGQLGLKEVIHAERPIRIDFKGDRKFSKIYVGFEHSMAISKNNEIFVWGDGESGQLGRHLYKSDEPLTVDDLMGREVIKGYINNVNIEHVDTTVVPQLQGMINSMSGEEMRVINSA